MVQNEGDGNIYRKEKIKRGVERNNNNTKNPEKVYKIISNYLLQILGDSDKLREELKKMLRVIFSLSQQKKEEGIKAFVDIVVELLQKNNLKANDIKLLIGELLEEKQKQEVTDIIVALFQMLNKKNDLMLDKNSVSEKLSAKNDNNINKKKHLDYLGFLGFLENAEFKDGIEGIQIEPKSGMVAISSSSGDIFIYKKEKLIKKLEDCINPGEILRFGPYMEFNPKRSNEIAYITAGSDEVKIYDIEVDEIVWYIRSDEKIRAISWSSDGEYIAIGGDDGGVRIYDTKENKLILNYIDYGLKLGDGVVGSISWSPDGSCIALGYIGRKVKIYNIKKSEVIEKYDWDCKDIVTSVIWSPDGKYLASIITLFAEGKGFYNKIEIYDITIGRKIREYEPYEGVNIYSLSWSPDGSCVALGCRDGKVRIYNVKEGKVMKKYDYAGVVNSVSRLPDGKHIIIGGEYKISSEGGAEIKRTKGKIKIQDIGNLSCQKG